MNWNCQCRERVCVFEAGRGDSRLFRSPVFAYSLLVHLNRDARRWRLDDETHTKYAADNHVGDRPRRRLKAAADNDEEVAEQDAPSPSERHADHGHEKGADCSG